LTARILWSPNTAGSGSNDKGYSGDDASHRGAGWDLTLTATSDMTGIDGLTVWGGISEVDQRVDQTCISGDAEEMTVGIKYATGGFTFGYQVSEEDTGRTGVTQYDNDAYGITFAINDDLSIGYNHYESDGSGNDADLEADAIQISYTMGGATINIAEASADNMKYQTGAAHDRNATTVAVSLAF
jgi:outer membrane protein OmpU